MYDGSVLNQLGARVAPNTYRRIAAVLRERISDGTYSPGEQLPTHTEIGNDLGVSRQVVIAAVRELVQEGLLRTEGRAGTFVRERVVFATDATAYDHWEPRNTTKDAFMAAVAAAGRVADKRFEMKIEPANARIAARLDLDEQELVCVRSVVQYIDEQPWSWAISYYPFELARETGLTTPDDIDSGTVRHLASQGYVEHAWFDETFARQPDPDEARHLDLPPGTSLLVWIRTACTAPPNEVINRVTVTLLAGDRNALIHQQGETSGRERITKAREQRQVG